MTPRQGFGPSPPRSTGTRSPALAVGCEEGRGSFEQIALLLQTRVLFAQRAKLFELSAGRHIGALAAVGLGLATPVSERLLGHAEALCQLGRGPAGTQHLHRLTAELRRIRGSGLWHVEHHPCAPTRRASSSVRKTGGTPPRRGSSASARS